MKLTDDKKAAIFKQLASKTFMETGMSFGLDKYYKDMGSVKNAVYSIYKQVKANPDQYAIQEDTMDLVIKAISDRHPANISMGSRTPSMVEKHESLTKDIKALTIGGRDSAMRLINIKLAKLEKSPKALRNESLVSLGKIFGILFDKTQIISGQATEHIAVMSKISKDMSPEESISMVLKMRETQNNAD